MSSADRLLLTVATHFYAFFRDGATSSLFPCQRLVKRAIATSARPPSCAARSYRPSLFLRREAGNSPISSARSQKMYGAFSLPALW
jgi:hypothetical protein